MSLIINYNDFSKILSNASSYTELTKFVEQSFSKLPRKWAIQYKNCDGDMITLASQLDFKNMKETCTLRYTKLYVVPVEERGEHIVSLMDKAKSMEEQIKMQEIKKEQVHEEAPKEKIEESQPSQTNPQMENPMKEWREKRGQWMRQKITKIIDDRMTALLPCLVKQIEERLRDKAENKPQKKSQSDVIHQVECKGCKKNPIIGIRYKCQECLDFNFCEICQEEIQHQHPFTKMRAKEVPKVQKQQQFKGFPCGFGGRGSKDHHGKPSNRSPMHWQHDRNRDGDFNRPPHSAFGFPGVNFPQGFPFNKGNGFKQMRENQKDVQRSDLRLTKKCFKMAERLGGQAGFYQQFVKTRLDKRVPQIIKEWAVVNNLDLSKFDEQKIERKSKKLAFQHKKDPSEFRELVRNNIDCNLHQLNMIIQNSKFQGKVQEQQKGPEFKPIKVGQDIVKQQDVILALKELFGEQDIFKYVKFYEQNTHLSKEGIIQKYINQIMKK